MLDFNAQQGSGLRADPPTIPCNPFLQRGDRSTMGITVELPSCHPLQIIRRPTIVIETLPHRAVRRGSNRPPEELERPLVDDVIFNIGHHPRKRSPVCARLTWDSQYNLFALVHVGASWAGLGT